MTAWYICSVTRATIAKPSMSDLLVDALRYGVSRDATSARQLANRLFRKPPDGISDLEGFREKLGQVIVMDAGQGSSLRELAPVALPRDSETSMQLIVVAGNDTVRAPILNAREDALVSGFLREQHESPRLAAAGIEPARTMLLVGPPGVGKTMTARYIAAELGLPLVSVDLAALMSSYLGRTGQNLRKVLDYARGTRCVFLLDEFDALAKRRDDDSDIGELKRIVNVLLLELEDWPAGGILLAATNHPELLDRAIQRRFDAVIALDLPDPESRRRIISEAFTRAGREVSEGFAKAAAAATEGWSGSDLDRASLLALRHAVLDGLEADAGMTAELLRARSTSEWAAHQNGDHNGAPKALAFMAVTRGGLTHREVSELIGVSHVTVGRWVRAWQLEAGEPADDRDVSSSTDGRSAIEARSRAGRGRRAEVGPVDR
jgi:MoxR-like ATPase